MSCAARGVKHETLNAQIERLSEWAGTIADLAEFGAWDRLAAYRKYYADLLRETRKKGVPKSPTYGNVSP